MTSSSALSPGGYVRQGTKGVPPPRAVNVQVAVRCRPLNARETSSGEKEVLRCDPNAREIICTAPFLPRKGAQANLPGTCPTAVKKTYVYDHVFGQEALQADVYEGVVEPIVDEVLQGYNCTVFAYGQTGTGKTHTMEGRRDDQVLGMAERRLPDNAGIIPRSVKQIFDHLRSITDEHTVRVSHLEIYNEQLSDLLGPEEDYSCDTLRVYEDSSKGTFVQGLDEVLVRSEDEIFAILDKSANKRRTAETLMNKYSSRSHSVFTITIHIKESTPDGADLLKVGKLNLVDLAGSENVGRSGAVKGRAREAGNINQSLLTLGRVITALVEKHPHVPYRDSKLTRLLQESLGGRNKTCIIATITPGSSSSEETASTLEYAHRAKSIKNRPTINQMIAKHVLLKEYTDEITKIRRELDACRTKNGIYLPPEDYDRLVLLSRQQKETISDMELRIEDVEQKNHVIREKLTMTQGALSRTHEDLERKEHQLADTQSMLQENIAKLKTASQERDEAHHLLGEHISSERSLYDNGCSLSTSLGLAVTDVDDLHARLEAGKDAETCNERSLFDLRARCAAHLETVQSLLCKHQGAQKESLLACRDQTTTMKDAVDSHVRKVVEGLAHMRKRASNLLAERIFQLRDFENSCASSEKSVLEQLQSQCDKQSEATKELELIADALVSDIRTQVESLQVQLAGMLVKADKCLATQEHHLEAFFKTQSVQLADLESTLNEQFEAQNDVLRKAQEDIGTSIHWHVEQAREAEEMVLQNVKSIMGTFFKKSKTSAAEILNTSKEHTAAIQASSRNIHSALQQYAQSATTLSSNVVIDAKDLRASMRDEVQGEVSQVQIQAETARKRVDDFARASGRQVQLIKEGSEASRTGLVQVSDLTGAEREKRIAQFDSLSQDCSAFLTCCSNTISEDADLAVTDISAAGAKLKDDLAMIETSTSAVVRDITSEKLPSVNSEVASFVLKTDENATCAPPRRSWEYPKELSKTQGHGVLLKAYRAQHGFDDIPTPEGLPSWDNAAASENAMYAEKFSESGEEQPDRARSVADEDDAGSHVSGEDKPHPSDDANDGMTDTVAENGLSRQGSVNSLDDNILSDRTNLFKSHEPTVSVTVGKLNHSTSGPVQKRSLLKPPIRRSMRHRR